MKKKLKKCMKNELIVVVPDGLRIGRNFKPYLTNTYRSVLKKACKQSIRYQLKILLLPANNFGSSKSEEDLGKEYLLKKGIKKNMIIVGFKKSKKYLDTLDNFNQAILYGGKISGKFFKVSNYLKEGNYRLITSYIHGHRVLRAIKLLKLRKPKKVFLIFSTESHDLPLRIFYYKYPSIHFMYEILASFYQTLKIFWI